MAKRSPIPFREFVAYTVDVWKLAARLGSSRGVGVLLGLIIGVVILILQLKLAVIPTDNKVAIRWLTVLLPYGLCFGLLAIWYVWRATFEMYRDKVESTKDAYEQIDALKEAVEKERGNLQGCPQVVLEYGTCSPVTDTFFVRSSTADALSVCLEPAESYNYLLTSDSIHYIQQGQCLPLGLRLRKKDNVSSGGPSEAKYMEAWNLFGADIFASKTGVTDATGTGDDWAQEIAEILNNLTNKQIIIQVAITYTDLSGREYRSPAKVSWAGLRMKPDVRPEPIVRVPKAA